MGRHGRDVNWRCHGQDTFQAAAMASVSFWVMCPAILCVSEDDNRGRAVEGSEWFEIGFTACDVFVNPTVASSKIGFAFPQYTPRSQLPLASLLHLWKLFGWCPDMTLKFSQSWWQNSRHRKPKQNLWTLKSFIKQLLQCVSLNPQNGSVNKSRYSFLPLHHISELWGNSLCNLVPWGQPFKFCRGAKPSRHVALLLALQHCQKGKSCCFKTFGFGCILSKGGHAKPIKKQLYKKQDLWLGELLCFAKL